MALLTKDQILAANDLPTETVAVPEWGGEVLVKSMTGAERDAYEAAMVETRKDGKVDRAAIMQNLRARLCAACMVDESGAALFTGKEVEALGKKSAAALQRVFNVAQRLNGLSPEDVKELAGNSDAGPSAGSGSN